MERVADKVSDERGEAAEDEHAGGKSQDDEEQAGVAEDEGETLAHVGAD